MIRTGLSIESPEGVSLTYELASPTERALAFSVDLMIRAAVILALGLLLFGLLGRSLLSVGMAVMLLTYFAVNWIYYIAFEMLWDGQSPGKRAFNLRVIKLAGHPIGFFDSALRNLLRAADFMPLGCYAAGATSMLLTRRFQRLGDLAAGTVVVAERKSWYTSGLARDHDRTAPPAPTSTLRGVSLSNRERRLLAEFVDRRPRLHPDRAEQIAAILAAPYRDRLGVEWDGANPVELLSRLHASATAREVRR